MPVFGFFRLTNGVFVNERETGRRWPVAVGCADMGLSRLRGDVLVVTMLVESSKSLYVETVCLSSIFKNERGTLVLVCMRDAKGR